MLGGTSDGPSWPRLPLPTLFGIVENPELPGLGLIFEVEEVRPAFEWDELVTVWTLVFEFGCLAGRCIFTLFEKRFRFEKLLTFFDG